MAFGPGHPFPRVPNQSINLAVMLKQSGHEERFGSVSVPKMFPRLWRIPGQRKSTQFVCLEEMIAANIDALFPGLDVISISPFRITREAGACAGNNIASKRLPSGRTRNGRRPFGSILKLEVERGTPARIRDLLIRNLGISPDQAIAVDGPLK